MSNFWRMVKRGFAYGLGGRLGWELGGLIWRMIPAALIAMGFVAVGKWF